MMEMSESIAELATALAKAQGEITAAGKDAENPAFKRDGKILKYATLASVWEACRAALSKNGIAVIQAPGTDENSVVTMTTTIVHSSGQWMRSTMACRPAQGAAQAIGSVVTYLRRYSLAAMVGVAPDDDDDGEAAVGRGAGNGEKRGPDMLPSGQKGTEKPATQPATQKQSSPPNQDQKTSVPAAEGEKPAHTEKSPFVFHLGDGKIQEFPQTFKGANGFVDLLGQKCQENVWYWTANEKTAQKIASINAGYKSEIDGIYNTILSAVG